MTVGRWVTVKAEYPSASIEVGPEDLDILLSGLGALRSYYPNGAKDEEYYERMKNLGSDLTNLRHELYERFGPRPKTKKEAWAEQP